MSNEDKFKEAMERTIAKVNELHQEITEQSNEMIGTTSGKRLTMFFEKVADVQDVQEMFLLFQRETGMFLERFARYYTAVGLAHLTTHLLEIPEDEKGEIFKSYLEANSEPDV